jgi:hypothetical protein
VRNSASQIEAAGVVALALAVAFILSSLLLVGLWSPDESPTRVDHGATDAPFLVTGLAGVQEQRRRQGMRYARDTEELADAWFRRNDPRDGEPALDASDMLARRRWAESRGLAATATDSGFEIRASSTEEPGVWFRLDVDRAAGRISATCGGNPTEYCNDGHWPIDAFGGYHSFLLGRD